MRPDESHRRRFLQRALTVAATLVSPWTAPCVLAAEHGRALIGFQLPPPAMRVVSELLTAIQPLYQPDLGTKPIVLAGSSSALALQTVINAAPDGGTVYIGPSSLVTFVPLLQKLAFDPASGLVPVAGIGSAPLVFMVGLAVPAEVRTMADYVQWVGAHPKANSYGVPSLGDVPHFVGTQLSRNIGLTLRAVGYKGPFALAEDLQSGAIPAAITLLPGPDEMAQRPLLRSLCVMTSDRLPALPDLPTLAQTGFGDQFPDSSLGIFMPVGTPEAKVAELAAAVRAATATPAVIRAMATVGLQPRTAYTEPYAVELTRERSRWKALLEKSDFTGVG